jgi:hypothetical protein
MKGLFAYLLLSLGVAHADETQRLVTHFDTVIDELQAADTGGLTPIARAARARLIEALSQYRDGRRFPRNSDFAESTPYFVDDAGTRCAMAHLIEVSGHPEIVEAVASTRNNAYIKELADEPALLAWLDAHGLTVAEAARIQPGYRCVDAAACSCRLGADGPHAIYRVRVSNLDWGSRAVEVEVEEVLARHPQAGFAVGASVPSHRINLRLSTGLIGTSLIGTIERGTFVPSHVMEGDSARCLAGVEDGTGHIDKAPGIPSAILIEAIDTEDCRNTLIAYEDSLDDPKCMRREIGDGEGCTQRPGDGGSPLLALLLRAAVRLRRVA